MNVKDFISELQKVNQDLPVCLADWNEEYALPNETAAEIIAVVEGKYNNVDEQRRGKFLLIGSVTAD